jgi:hypothetical protein
MAQHISFYVPDEQWINTSAIIIRGFEENLPFPLNLPYYLRTYFAVYIFLVLVLGLKCRKILFDYFAASATKLIPINGLAFANLLNGTFFGSLNLVFTIFSLILTVPIKNVLGEHACNLIALSGCFHVIGLIVWSCLFAIGRILYLKAQNLFKNGPGELNCFSVCISLGIVFQLSLSMFLFQFEDGNFLRKLCSHRSAHELEIFQHYMASSLKCDLLQSKI